MLSTFERNTSEVFILGAQKARTTWLWSMLEQHRQHLGNSLPGEKRSIILAHQNLSREVKISHTCISQLE